jgi:hypothetical protein
MVSRNVKLNVTGSLDSSIWEYDIKCPGCEQEVYIIYYDQFELVRLTGENHVNQGPIYYYEKGGFNLNFGIEMLCKITNKIYKGRPGSCDVRWII